MIDNTILKYKGKIFHNEEELKNFYLQRNIEFS